MVVGPIEVATFYGPACTEERESTSRESRIKRARYTWFIPLRGSSLPRLSISFAYEKSLTTATPNRASWEENSRSR